MATDIRQLLPTNVRAALLAGSAPSSINPYVTASALSSFGFVPYTGATANVDLGAFSLTTPLIVGGSAVGSVIQYKGTSGVGTSTVAAHQFLVGNNGATVGMNILNSGNVSINPSTSIATLHLGVTPSASNYMLSNAAGAGSTYLNAPTGGFVVVSIGGGNRFQVNNSSITFAPTTATATNATTCYAFSFSSNTNQTLSTEIPGVLYNNYSRNWATGNITIQREQYIKTVTYTAIGASVIASAYGFYVEAPTASTNITITNNYAAGFQGNIHVTGGSNRIYFTGGTNYYIESNANTRVKAASEVFIDAGGGSATIRTSNTLWQWGSGLNMSFDTTTGTKIATATTQKIGFWNATPIVQPTTAVASATVVSGAGGNVKHDDTFDGYTVEKVVRALRNIGLLA